MQNRPQGFSLIELIMAMTITVAIGMFVFQLFKQNEKVFNDQDLVIEMQQTARVVASQIADEIRMAGQGVPVFASTYDSADNEATAIFLSGSGSDTMNFRAVLSNTETNVTTATPLASTLGISRTLTVGSASLFSNTLGTTAPTGKYVYIWGPADNSMWTWVRAHLTGISTSTNTVTITPTSGGTAGRTAGANEILGDSDDVITFTAAPAVTLEEGVSFYLEGGSVKRATAAGMAAETSPAWSSGQEIGRNVTSLAFTYYDRNNNAITPNTLANRSHVARVDVKVVVEASAEFSNGARQTYALSVRSIPRSSRMR